MTKALVEERAKTRDLEEQLKQTKDELQSLIKAPEAIDAVQVRESSGSLSWGCGIVGN